MKTRFYKELPTVLMCKHMQYRTHTERTMHQQNIKDFKWYAHIATNSLENAGMRKCSCQGHTDKKGVNTRRMCLGNS